MVLLFTFSNILFNITILINKGSAIMIRYEEPFDGKRFLANKRSKEIHDLENSSSMCNIDNISEKNILMIESENEVVDLCHSEGYNGCYWCLPRYNDENTLIIG